MCLLHLRNLIILKSGLECAVSFSSCSFLKAFVLPIFFANFVFILWVCSFQVRFSSIHTPKYLTHSDLCKISLFKFNFIFLDSSHCLGLIIIKFELLVFRVSLFAISQS